MPTEVVDEVLQDYADRAYAMENTNFDYGSPGDEKLTVKFEMHAHLDDVLSREQGRPRFAMQPYIKIMTPGDKDTVIHRPVREGDKQRFAKQYERFVAGQSQSIGQPLSEWMQISRAHVEELAFFNVHTIEQLAGMSDGVTGRFMGMTELKQKAQKYLVLQKDDAPMAKLESELAKRDEIIVTMQAQIAQLAEANAKKTTVAVQDIEEDAA